MVKNSGDTQARFLAKSLALLLAANCAKEYELQKNLSPQICADERRGGGLSPVLEKEIYRKGREEAQREHGQKPSE